MILQSHLQIRMMTFANEATYEELSEELRDGVSDANNWTD